MASLSEKGARVAKNAVFTYFLKRATKLVGKPVQIFGVLAQAVETLKDRENPKSGVRQVFELMFTVVRLIRAWAGGHYRGVSPFTVVSGVAVLLYVISPIDLVPDFIPVLGFMDDLSLMAWFIGKFRDEIQLFQEWEAEGQPDAQTPADTYTSEGEPSHPNLSLPPAAELGHS